MKKILCILCLIASYVHGFTPSTMDEQRALTLSKKINAYIERLSGTKKTTILHAFAVQLPQLQTRFIGAQDISKMYLLEYIRRHLPDTDIIDTPDLLDDDAREFTWTHATKGFDVLYSPYDTQAFGALDPEKNYTTLINGTYFGRTEGGNYHAGILYFGGERYTRFIDDDPQVTHIFCREKTGTIRIWENSHYTSEDVLKPCDLAFQFGPLIYRLEDGRITEKLAPKTYIGGSHTRTVMVIFEKENGQQDVWFLTVYTKMTLAQVRDIVLSETRFIGTYKNISVLNLDGGSSVAYISRKYPELNFGTSKKLPIVFGIK